MRRVFGSSKPKAPPPNLGEAISNIDARADTVEKKIGKLDADLVKLKDQLKGMREGPSKNLVKQRALRLLKQKRQYENQKNQLDTQSFNMEQSNFAIQSMKDNQVTFSAMKDGLKVMQKEYKKMNIDDIDQLNDEMEDMLEMNNEVQDALSRQYDCADIDETELEAELEALGNELDFEADSTYLDEAISAPGVPSKDPGAPSASRTESGVLVDEFGLPKLPA